MLLNEQTVGQTASIADLSIALMLARNFDRANICAGLAIIAKMLAGEDPDVRSLLAHTLLTLARELDPDLASAMSARWEN